MKKNRFETLEHNGPFFPEPYNPIHINVKGIPLSVESEEMLNCWARISESEHAKDSVFLNNFKSDFIPTLPSTLRTLRFPEDFVSEIKKLKKVQEMDKVIKASRTKKDKEDDKKEKDNLKNRFGFAIVDGKKQPIGVWQIEPAGIFMGRGDIPIRGCWKKQAQPEDVIINCTINTPVAPNGHKWGKVQNNKNSMSMWDYSVIVNGKKILKSARLGLADQTFDNDEHKFEKARTMNTKWKDLENHIDAGLKEKKEEAVIAWFMSKLAIRVGNDKDEKTSAMTYGMSTLLVKHLTIKDNVVYFSFLGKDSVLYENQILVTSKIESFLVRLMKKKNSNEKIFSVTSADVSKFLKEIDDSFSPKLFRTALAASVIVEELKKQKVKKSWSDFDKLMALKKSNLAVSRILNHKHAVSKNFDKQMEKFDAKIKEAELKVKSLKKESKTNEKKLEQYTKAVANLEKLEVERDLKEETKESALTTALKNYIDYRVVYSWCKDIDLDPVKVFGKSLFERTKWALSTPKGFWKEYPNGKKPTKSSFNAFLTELEK